MYLFFGVEATGQPHSRETPTEDVHNWPRLVQLAFQLHDEHGCTLTAGNYLIRPGDFEIPTFASRRHGFTTEQAFETGVCAGEALAKFEERMQQAEFLVAHDLSWPQNIIGAEFLRLGMDDPFEDRALICTMEEATEFCELEGPEGYRPPTLPELYRKLFNCPFREQPDAAANLHAVARCFQELLRLELIEFEEEEENVRG
jgi:hypothetical protein